MRAGFESEYPSGARLAPRLLLLLGLFRLAGFVVLGLVYPGFISCRVLSEHGINIPAVANHAHALGLSHAIKLCALLEIPLAANTLSIAEAGFRQSIDVAPGCKELVRKKAC